MTNKEWYAYCTENNLCVACHKPNDRENKKYCSECARKNSEKNKELREFYISMGVCPICRKNSLVGKMKSCEECRENRAVNKYARNAEDVLHYNAERRKKLRSEHKCTTCGKDLPPNDRHITCSKCREKQRKEYEEKLSQDRRQRPLENKCYICGSSDLVDGKNICVLCYKRILKNTEKMWEANRRKTNNNEQQ